LDVSGNVIVQGTSDNPLTLRDTRAGIGDFYLQFENSTGARDWVVGRRVTSGNFFIGGFSPGFVQVATFTTAGNVGIGTTTPGSVLSVTGNFSTTTGALLATSSGNVGIGTTSPGSSSVTGLSFSYGPILQVHSSARPSPTFSGTGVDFRFVDTDAGTNNKAGDIAYDDQVFVFRSIDDAGNLKTGNVLVINTSSGNVGIGTTGPASTLTVVGNFSATGTKSAVVNTSYGMRKLYAIESPDVSFYDRGTSQLSSGMANISLDPIFIETVEPDYQVYLTPEANTAGIYVAEKAKEYFIVKGRNPSSSIPFSWLITALRKGYRDTRLDLERKDGNTQITAVIDEENKITNIEINNENNNLLNAPGENATTGTNAITGKVTDEISKTNIGKSKITAATTNENEIINKIQERTNLSKEAIKKSITFKRKQPLKEEVRAETFEESAQQKQLTRVTEINGSVIIRLG